jgi:glutamate synthase domain-containing protein 2/glutamate synthase domain-containing protein 1/glutamate synthase domain-containing protein 3
MGKRPPFVPVDLDACGVGFVAQLSSRGSHAVVERALMALLRLSHRGGVDADGLSGDGAGLLTPIPRDFFRQCAVEEGLRLPGKFGVGMAFLPAADAGRARAAIERATRRAGLEFLGWRPVPTDASVLGPRAAATLPVILQCFVAPPRRGDFERSLFLLRKRIEAEAPAGTYFCSLSSRTVVYKGLLAPWQLAEFYPDLADVEFAAPFAVFHQRYSTNTRPTWSLAQPFRAAAHNGEINTIVSNRRWLRAREPEIAREFGAGGWFRAQEDGVSDSASLDNALEISLQQGYSLPAAMLRLVPPACPPEAEAPDVEPRLRRFLESSAAEQEPWDGPAALVFTDGRRVGAMLDRNGLRPMRYSRTTDGLVIAGSEAGLACFEGKQIAERGRLGPGEMLLVDAAAGKIYRETSGNGGPAAVGAPIAGARDAVASADVERGISVLLRCPKRAQKSGGARVLVEPPAAASHSSQTRPATADEKRTAAAYGWTEDQYRLLFLPLGSEGKEAVWSMGDDAPPAFLSRARRPLWDYCKQRFAQVTNPPIDPLRETHVMSLEVRLDGRVWLPSPLVEESQMARLRDKFFRPVLSVDITFAAAGGVEAAKAALARVGRQATAAIAQGGMVLLSDRCIGPGRAALPALLAVAAAWKAMVRRKGWRVPLVVESGQVIETHHVALLVAAGASAVHPFLALELAERASAGGAHRYRLAVEAGLQKVLARMGISCVASYRNSQLFELVGLEDGIAAEFFEDASSVLGAKPLEELLADALTRHAQAFADGEAALQDAGLYRFRQRGELHASSPDVVRRLHRYIAAPTEENYRAYSTLAAEREPVAVRDLLEFSGGERVPLDEVENEYAILARFSTQAMSLGALSPEAHRTLAIAMNRLGARSNTGEGGEDPDVYEREPRANNWVKQVASARFGVTAGYLVNAGELEIKMAQGSKPGEGGQLPATKVTPYIARLRHAVPGMALISPPPHHDIYSIEDLAQLIYDLRAVNPRARIGVKLVAGAGVGLIAAGVAKAGADVITISGFDGGTGASPLTSIKNTGLPWEAGLADTHRTLLRAGLRSRVRLRVDGGLKSGRDVVLAALLGADEFGFGTAVLLAIGCIMARQCHLNTCPAGIATQDETLRLRFTGNPEMVMHYFRGVAGEVRELLAGLGARSLTEIRGATGLLRAHPRAAGAAKAVASLLEPPEAPSRFAAARMAQKDSGVHLELRRLLTESEDGPRVFRIANSDRTTGAHLSGEILRRRLVGEPAPQTLECEFRGTAGQSFGAFLIPGLHFRLTGEANDYVGKGLSGGTISISAGPEASLRGDVLAGNTVLYGATSGALFLAGRAGERFAVRNSGALAVAEGLGHHGCEYMTAGVAVILGPVGRNFGSGMTGGVAYVARDDVRENDLRRDYVRLAEAENEEQVWLRRVLREHLRLTGSARARTLLRLRGPLPLVRVEPVRLPCSIAQTWTMAATRLLHPQPAVAAAMLPRKAQPGLRLEAIC